MKVHILKNNFENSEKCEKFIFKNPIREVERKIDKATNKKYWIKIAVNLWK